jgi:threonine/homoserine/homoserine lactone efflux protein
MIEQILRVAEGLMWGSLAAFAVFAAVLTVTPGLDTILVLRTAAVVGRRAGLAAVLGILLGCLVWAVASALGVTAILTASQLAFDALRIAGAVYLFWLGARALWRARRRKSGAPEVAGQPGVAGQPELEVRPAGAWSAFRTGLTTNLLNPKVGVFYLSVMPQFLPIGVDPLAGSLALGAVHVLEGLIWLSLVVIAVGRARGWLTRPRVRRRLEQVTGVVFLGFGLRLAIDPGIR